MTRVVSGALLLVVVVSAVWFLPPVYLLGLSVMVALLAFREFAALAGRIDVRISRVAGGLATAVACIALGVPGLPLDAALLGATLGLAAIVLASGRRGAEALHDVSASVFAPMYIGLPLGALVAIRWQLGREAVLLLMVTVFVSDTMQYYTGRLFGRRLLAPAISPKKTVEGAVGGFVGGAVTMIAAGHWWLSSMGLPVRLGLGLVVVSVGIVGDLFESQLKRSVGMKDASALIPGHGGMLDRIDALLFAAPVYYLFVRYGLTP